MVRHLRRRTLFRTAALAGALLAFAACSKKGSENPVKPPGSSTATFTGLVASLAAGGGPVPSARVGASPSSGTEATSNAQGLFSLAIPSGAVTVTVSKAGFAPHPLRLNVAAGAVQTAAVSMLPIAASPVVTAATGSTVSDPGAKTSILLTADFVTGVANVVVDFTGLDPSSFQALAFPGTFDARNLLNATGHLRPVSLADLRISDGLDTEYPLAHSVQLELAIPVPFQGLPEMASGSLVQCFHFDDATGTWQAFAQGVVGISSVYGGQPAVKVGVTQSGWFAAGLFDGGAACAEGVVSSGGTPVPGADVQAFPGGIAHTDDSGVYTVDVPPSVPVQLVATRPSGGTVTVGAASGTSGTIGGGCLAANIALQNASGQTYVVRAQLIRGRDALSVPRDEALVKIVTNATNPVPVDGATVQINPGTGWITLPRTAPGLYSEINGQGASLTLVPGAVYALRVDITSDGTIDGAASVLMPGAPTISAPAAGSGVDPTFVSAWTDPAGGIPSYTARYIGSFESSNFGTFPARFVVLFPEQSKTIGDGVFDDINHMPNDPLLAGEYTFRVWATNGPVQYAIPGFVLFTTPNITGTGVSGWFSAIAQADSIKFTSLGSGGAPAIAARR
jgi:hypothetical protein